MNHPSTTPSWNLEFARLIAFRVKPTTSLDQEWWQEVACRSPDEYPPTKRHDLHSVRGTLEGNLLILSVDPTRIVWEIRSPKTGPEPDGTFPVLGEYRAKLDWFVRMLGPWLVGSCPPIPRLALHTKLLQLCPSEAVAYDILKRQLPGVQLLDPSGPEKKLDDFLLQVNRRTKPRVPGLESLALNRVTTWYKMNLGVALERGKPFQWPERCYSALEMDINTPPEHLEPLPPAALPSLLETLVALGESIIGKGLVALEATTNGTH